MENTKQVRLFETLSILACNLTSNPGFASFPRSFAFPNELPEKSILFLGLQPLKSEQKPLSLKSYQLEHGSHEILYFKQFDTIAKNCNSPWAHLNLLFFRKTKHCSVDELVKTEAGVQFIREQLKVSNQIIRQISPEIIVLTNSEASKLMGFNKTVRKDTWLNYEFAFDNEIGTYRWDGTPVFFTSLFQGRENLNKGSFERLKWHIRNTLIFDLEKKKKEVVDFKNEVVKSQKNDLAAEIRKQERELENRLVGLRFN